MVIQKARLTGPTGRQLQSFVRRLWRQLQSMTFAIVMLSVILVVIIAGSFLPQQNGITYVYESWWFYGLNLVLMASVLSCSSRRIASVYRFAFKVPIIHRASFYRTGDTARVLDAELGPEAAALAISRALKGRGYRVAIEHREQEIHVLSDRFRVFRLGTLVSHLSIVLLVATLIWSALAGWLDQGILLEAGGVGQPIGHGTGLTLYSTSFNFGFYPDGTPRNFKDHLTLVARSGRVYHQVIDVNTPWYFGGVFGYDIHQASYGMTARLIVLNAHGQVQPYCLVQLGATDCSKSLDPMLMVPLGDGSYKPVGSSLSAFYLPSQKLVVTLTTHDPVPEANLPTTAVVTVLRPPQNASQGMHLLKVATDLPITTRVFNGTPENISQPLSVDGLKIAVLVRRLTSLNVGHNPAVPFIFASCVLIILGLVSVLYFPFTRLWLLVVPADSDGTTSMIFMRGSAEKSKQGFKRRFGELVNNVQRELQRERERRIGVR
jgi:cytochrome c biogenesis protein ResB